MAFLKPTKANNLKQSPTFAHALGADEIRQSIRLLVCREGDTVFNRLNGALDLGVVAIRNFLVAANRSLHSIVDDNPAIGASGFLVRNCVLGAIEDGSRAPCDCERAILGAKAIAGTVGYFERGTHDVCDVADCAVLRPELQQALENVRSLLPDKLPEDLTEIEAVSGDEGVALAPPLAGYSDQDVTRRIGGEVYRFGATSFFQINHELLERLIATAVADTHGQAALDLYCGVGLFTLPLARRYPRATAVEANKAAANYARLNLSNAQLTNATVITARVAEWLNRIDLVEKEFDFVLLDPPRTGAEPVVIERILALRPRKISYVSCDPATLARDLKLLLGDGYQLTSVAALDMFPQTHHVETVVQLTTG